MLRYFKRSQRPHSCLGRQKVEIANSYISEIHSGNSQKSRHNFLLNWRKSNNSTQTSNRLRTTAWPSTLSPLVWREVQASIRKTLIQTSKKLFSSKIGSSDFLKEFSSLCWSPEKGERNSKKTSTPFQIGEAQWKLNRSSFLQCECHLLSGNFTASSPFSLLA